MKFVVITHSSNFKLSINLLVKITRELDLPLENLLIDGHGVVIVERIYSGDHFVGEDTEGPPVDWLSVALVKEYLRRKIFGRPTESVGTSLAVFCETEIRKF